MFRFLSPSFFNKASKKTILPLATALASSFTFALYQALIASPIDYQQGEMVRIMYIHVPAAWMSLGVYSFIAICSFSSLIWKTTMSYIFAVAAAPIGASFALITLVTGSLWGKPIWGTWWVWDARLTSMLVLFLLYLAYIAVVSSGDTISRAEKPAAVIALIGFINVPVVKFSVDLWHSLHQPASILKFGGPSIHSSMLLPLFMMFGSYILFFLLVLILRTHIIMRKFKNF